MHVLENGSIVLYQEGAPLINRWGSTIPMSVLEKLVERVQAQGHLTVEFGQPEQKPGDTSEAFAKRNNTIDETNRCGQLENLRIEKIDDRNCLVGDFKVDEAFVEIEAKFRRDADGRPTLAHRGFCMVDKVSEGYDSKVVLVVTWDLVTDEKLYGPKEER